MNKDVFSFANGTYEEILNEIKSINTWKSTQSKGITLLKFWLFEPKLQQDIRAKEVLYLMEDGMSAILKQ